MAVVDEKGHLQGTLSSSQLRGLTPDDAGDLLLPLDAFLPKRKLVPILSSAAPSLPVSDPASSPSD